MQICKFEGCDRLHQAKGYCNAHYMQIRRGIKLKELKGKPPKLKKKKGRPLKLKAVKLTDKQVEEIREKYATGWYMKWQISKEYGVPDRQLSRVIK